MDSALKKVLIVDDDARNIFALSAVLKTRGYDCLTAASAAEALALLEVEKSVGIVLMDVMMPGMDGYEALGRIRDLLNPPPPLIAVTANAMSGDREKCLAAGADEYISKPIDVDRLFSLLDIHLK